MNTTIRTKTFQTNGQLARPAVQHGPVALPGTGPNQSRTRQVKEAVGGALAQVKIAMRGAIMHPNGTTGPHSDLLADMKIYMPHAEDVFHAAVASEDSESLV